MKPVDRLRDATVALLLVSGIVSACRNEASPVNSAVGSLAAAPVSTTGPSFVDITWMSISNIYYQLGPLNILTDGYFTRIPHSEFFGGGGGLAHTTDALKPNVPAVLQVRDALGGASAVNFLLTGHSHFDHAFDTATWANATGAPIYGSKTTCFQVVAQNVPAQCTPIVGGERITLSDGVTMRVVRWNHSGDSTTNPEQHNPVELEAAPTPDPVTGGLHAGVADAFPNGGGSRGFLFTVDGPQGRFSWFFQNSASTSDLSVPIVVDGVNYGAPLANLEAAMSDAGLTSVDLWIGTGGQPVANLVVPVLKPKAYLPVHWDDMFSPFLNGVASAFSDSSLEAFLSQSGVSLVRPLQYMDKWRLDVTGVVAISNGQVKKALGFCKPVTSCPSGKNCGTIADGCDGTVSCGPACSAPQTCGGGGTANVCGCTPLPSCPSGKNCGVVADGCGGTVSCGSACSAPQICGGGGTANVCGCTPLGSCPSGKNCGAVADGCGGTVSCGSACSAPQTCGGGGTANVCGCTPMASCPSGKNCGTVADGCGGTVSCGPACGSGGPGIATDQSSYAAGATVTVTYAGLPGNPKDWISLAPAGSPDTTWVAWVFTGGQISGTATFSAPHQSGSYVVRAFLNNTWTRLAESASFTVTAPITMSTISTDQSSYAGGATVTVTYAGLPGNAQDWIALAPAGSPDTSLVAWVFTGGQTSGTATFSAPHQDGSYVARAFLNNTWTRLAESASFTVTVPITTSTISTDQSSYAADATVTVTYAGLPGNVEDWISLAPAGSPDTTWVAWVFTGGQTSGTAIFSAPLQTGSYVARAFLNNTWTLLGESASFTVTP